MRPDRRRPPGTAPRRGFALPVVIFALVLLAVIVGGFAAASGQDFRVSRNSLVEQRAFGIAEQGLNFAYRRWGQGGGNIIPTLPAAGDTSQLRVVSRDLQDTSIVTLSRLTAKTYWLTSHGTSGLGNTSGRSERRVSMVMRLAKPQLNFGGALTTFGGVDLRGNALISGRDVDPTGWNAVECGAIPNVDTAAVAYSPGSTYERRGSAAVDGAVRPDARAGQATTYTDFGAGVTWATLTSGATITLTGSPNPQPAGTATTCNTSGALQQTNWGEPSRTGTGFVAGCTGYFPVIYSPSSLNLNSSSRGQGVLLVNGDLRINGNFDFAGIIIVRGDLDVQGTATIVGTVMAENANLTQTASVFGTAEVLYSGCAVERAATAAGYLVPSTRRSWAPLN